MNEKHEAIRLQTMKDLGFGTERMQELKVCTSCGNASAYTETVCGDCRAVLPDKTLYDIYKERHTVCKGCQTVVGKGSMFCPQCGTKIK